MQLIKGENLTLDQIQQVKNTYIYRHTGDHFCDLTPKTHETDMEWIDDHAFYITDKGLLSRNHAHCEPYYMGD